MARTILTECAWASLRYNPWAKGIYERICGKQKTRKKKAAIALARKIAVLAWAMLRDEKDWDPKTMIQVTESFGKMNPSLKESLQEMKPKENHDQRKSRLRKEARAAKEAATMKSPKSDVLPTKSDAKQTSKSPVNPKANPLMKAPTRRLEDPHSKPTPKRVAKPKANTPTSEQSPSNAIQITSKPRRARKPVSAV